MREHLLFLFLIACTTPAFSHTDGVAVEWDTTIHKGFQLNEVEIISNPKANTQRFEFPGSISFFNAKKLDRIHAVTLKDLSTLAPNLFIPDYGSKLISSVYIRGIGSRINSPAVGLNVDNVPYLDKSSFDFDLLDIEKIEILRGPQGTLYGRNTMAGLINIYTKNPFEYNGTTVKVGYGNYNAINAAVSHYNKINNKVAFSLGGYYRRDNGYFSNTNPDAYRKQVGSSEVGGGRARINWRVNKRLKIDFTGDMEYSTQMGYPYSHYDKSNKSKGTIDYNDRASYDRLLSTSSIFLQYIHDRFIMSSTTSYQFLRDNMHMDQDFTPLSIFTLQQRQRQNAVTQELVFRSTTKKRVEWVAGLFGFYSHLNTLGPVNFKKDGIKHLIEGMVPKNVSINDNMSIENLKLTIDNSNIHIGGVYKTPSFGWAIFKQATINHLFIEGLSATIGLRLDYEKNQIDYNTSVSEDMKGKITLDMKVGPTSRPLVIPIKGVRPQIIGNDQTDSWQILPKFELKYTPNQDVFMYVTIARGYRSGGYNFQMFSNIIQKHLEKDIMDQTPMPKKELPTEDINNIIKYKPEYSWNYETGARASLWEKRLNLDLSLFYIDCRNQQISVVSGYGRITKNSGQSASKGLELSANIRPIKNLTFATAYGFTHATFIKNNVSDKISYNRNFVPFAPQHTFSATGSYSIPVKCSWLDNIELNAQYIGRGKIYWTESNDVSQNFYGLFNADISLQKGCVELSAWAKNIFNNKYQAFYFEVMNATDTKNDNGFAQYGRPATVGVDITVRF